MKITVVPFIVQGAEINPSTHTQLAIIERMIAPYIDELMVRWGRTEGYKGAFIERTEYNLDHSVEAPDVKVVITISDGADDIASDLHAAILDWYVKACTAYSITNVMVELISLASDEVTV